MAIRLGQSTFFARIERMRLTGVHPDTFGEPSRAERAAALTGANFRRTAVRNLEGAGSEVQPP